MSEDGRDGFFSRWSSRKADAREGKPLPPEPPRAPAEAIPSKALASAPPGASGALPATGPRPPAPPAPTLNDVAQLTPSSDFSAFVRRDVASEVKNAALKKLFADPHFNQMDGLDVYIDDYSLPDPLSPGMLEQMTSVDFLNTPPADASLPQRPPVGDTAAPQDMDSVAQSHPSSSPADPSDHDDVDLRLQPDLAARRQGPGPEPV